MKKTIPEILNDFKSTELNLCYKGESCEICYNYGLSGDIVIIPNKGEPVKILAKDLMGLFSQVGNAYSKNPVLFGDDVIQHILNSNLLKSQQKSYFRDKSLLWKAIYNHICYEECVLIDLETDLDDEIGIVCHRGTGYGVMLKNVSIYGSSYLQDNEKPDLTFEIEVEYQKEYGNDFTRSYTISIPSDLEVNFTKEKFNKYIDELRISKENKKKSDDLNLLSKLIKEYPEKAEELLKIETGK